MSTNWKSNKTRKLTLESNISQKMELICEKLFEAGQYVDICTNCDDVEEEICHFLASHYDHSIKQAKKVGVCGRPPKTSWGISEIRRSYMDCRGQEQRKLLCVLYVAERLVCERHKSKACHYKKTHAHISQTGELKESEAVDVFFEPTQRHYQKKTVFQTEFTNVLKAHKATETEKDATKWYCDVLHGFENHPVTKKPALCHLGRSLNIEQSRALRKWHYITSETLFEQIERFCITLASKIDKAYVEDCTLPKLVIDQSQKFQFLQTERKNLRRIGTELAKSRKQHDFCKIEKLEAEANASKQQIERMRMPTIKLRLAIDDRARQLHSQIDTIAGLCDQKLQRIVDGRKILHCILQTLQPEERPCPCQALSHTRNSINYLKPVFMTNGRHGTVCPILKHANMIYEQNFKHWNGGRRYVDPLFFQGKNSAILEARNVPTILKEDALKIKLENDLKCSVQDIMATCMVPVTLLHALRQDLARQILTGTRLGFCTVKNCTKNMQNSHLEWEHSNPAIKGQKLSMAVRFGLRPFFNELRAYVIPLCTIHHDLYTQNQSWTSKNKQEK